MKNMYSSPELELILLCETDIITESSTTEEGSTEKETYTVQDDGSIVFPTIPFD